MRSLYIHIPFCEYICTYCDFSKKYIKNQPVDKYLEYLEKEIKLQITTKTPIKTIYIGGGTPSALNEKQLVKLGTIINKYFTYHSDIEFTFECNPDDVTPEKVAILKQIGVNRISLGVQTLNNELLKNLRRGHDANDVINALECLKNEIENVSLDFIFNLPNQTVNDIENTFDLIEKYQLKHISYYGLILEENTILDTQEYQLQDEDTESNWYEMIQKRLNEMGHEQYEISNYALNGYQSKHNLVYWKAQEYYGFGLGASGYLNQSRYTNVKSMKLYFDKIDADELPYLENEKLILNDLDYEKIFLNLRTCLGIEKSHLEKYQITYDKKYFIETKTMIRINPKYYYQSNEIIVNLLEQFDVKE